MNFKNVAIESLAYALPDEVWTSADVEAKLAPVYERSVAGGAVGADDGH